MDENVEGFKIPKSLYLLTLFWRFESFKRFVASFKDSYRIENGNLVSYVWTLPCDLLPCFCFFLFTIDHQHITYSSSNILKIIFISPSDLSTSRSFRYALRKLHLSSELQCFGLIMALDNQLVNRRSNPLQPIGPIFLPAWTKSDLIDQSVCVADDTCWNEPPIAPK